MNKPLMPVIPNEQDRVSISIDVPGNLQALRRRTAARILVGRSGSSYLTATQLELRQDHAAALDAIHRELDVERDFGRPFQDRWRLIEVATCAETKTQFLMRPDLGRQLNQAGRGELIRHCAKGADIQVVIGDGLSATAAAIQVPRLLPLLEQQSLARRWLFGVPFVIRYCRVGVLNDIGELLDPHVLVLLIGERPGLATVESLSAYLAYRPRAGHTDAQRNLISNIHSRGVSIERAAQRIVALAEKMRNNQTSGVSLKEDQTEHATR